MRPFLSKTATAALALATSLTCAATFSFAEPAVVGGSVSSVLPADSLIVLKVSNLKQTSAKLAKFTSQLGINMFVPQLADPLAALKSRLNIKGGINDDGELAFIFRKPAEGVEPDKSVLILVPVSDYAAFIGGLENATTEGAVTSFDGPGGDPSFVANWDGFAAIAPTESVIAAKPVDILKLDGKAAAEMKSADAVFYSNLVDIGTLLEPELAKGKTEGKAKFLQEVKDAPNYKPELDPLLETAFDQGFGAVEAFLRDGKASTISLNFVEQGVKTSLITEFKPGSYLQTAFAGIKNTTAPLTAGLPVANFITYGGAVNTSAATQKIVDDFIDPIIEKVPDNDDYAFVRNAKTLFNDYNAAAKRFAFAMPTPVGQVGTDALIQIVGFVQGEPVALKKATAELTELQGDFQAMMAQESIKYKSVTNPAAKTIAGVEFDEYVMTVEGEENDPFAAQTKQAFQMMYGSDSVKQYTGLSGDKVLTFMGVSDDQAAALVEAAKGESGALSAQAHVKTTASNLPSARFVEYYIALDQIVAAGGNAAGQFGMPIQIPALPGDLEPIGISISADNGTLEVHQFVSTRLLQTLISTGMQVMGQMQGGGGGGPGGL